MKMAVAALLCLVTMCSAATAVESQPTQTRDLWEILQDSLDDIYDKIKGKKTGADLGDLAKKLSDGREDAIDNLSETKLKDFLPTLKEEIAKTDKAFDQALSEFLDNLSIAIDEETLSKFFEDISKAFDANNEMPKKTGGRTIYYFP